MITKKEALNQLHSLRHTGLPDKLAEQAAAHGFALAFFMAIASRETNCIKLIAEDN